MIDDKIERGGEDGVKRIIAHEKSPPNNSAARHLLYRIQNLVGQNVIKDHGGETKKSIISE